MNSLQKFIENNTSSKKDSIFIINNQRTISYREFEKQVNNISFHLENKGIKKGDNIAVISENNTDFILLIFSLWKLNAVPVPINIKLLPKEIEEQITFAGCKFVVIQEILLKKFTHLPVNCTIIPFPFKIEYSQINSSKIFDKNGTALMLFTSGSSGRGKAVIFSYENLIQSFLIGNQVLNQNENDRWLASLPFYHIGGFSIMVRAFLSGASVIIPDSLKNEDIIKALKKSKPTLASFVSPQLQRLIESNIEPNKELKNILIGGGFTGKDLSLAAVKKGWKITKVYGSTEVSSFVSAISSDEILNRPGSSGKALHPNEIIIVDEKKKSMAPNELGEIAVKSPAVIKGYYKNPGETSKKLINNFYYTGDIGYLDTDGYLFVEARREDLIISGGENIIPREVESAILNYSYVDDVFVFGLDSSEWGQETAAAIVVKDNEKISSNDLRKFLREKLAAYKIPRKIFFLNEIPKTSLGKVQKEKLLEAIHGKL